jgi:hypothetical protein
MQATYIAPDGDAKSAEMAGFVFEDGIPVEVPADARIAGKLKTNWHFVVDEDAGPVESDGEDALKRRGRPPKAQVEPEDA